MKNFIVTLLAVAMCVCGIANEHTYKVGNVSKHVKYLSGHSCAGRQAGTAGFKKSVEYVSAGFEAGKLLPLSYNYTNEVPMPFSEVSTADVDIRYENQNINYQWGSDFVVMNFSGSKNVYAPMVFCGYGLDMTFYSDYAEVDVDGKIAVIMEEIPSFLRSRVPDINKTLYNRALNAKLKGAIGVMFVADYVYFNEHIAPDMTADTLQLMCDMPVVRITYEQGEKLLQNEEDELPIVLNTIRLTRDSKSFDMRSMAKIDVEKKYVKHSVTKDVYAQVKGTDSEDSSFILVVANLDHVGMQNNKSFSCMNDDVFAASLLMELARVYGQNPQRKTIVFALNGMSKPNDDVALMLQRMPNQSCEAVLYLHNICYNNGVTIQGNQSAESCMKESGVDYKCTDNLFAESLSCKQILMGSTSNNNYMPSIKTVKAEQYELALQAADNMIQALSK